MTRRDPHPFNDLHLIRELAGGSLRELQEQTETELDDLRHDLEHEYAPAWRGLAEERA